MRLTDLLAEAAVFSSSCQFSSGCVLWKQRARVVFPRWRPILILDSPEKLPLGGDSLPTQQASLKIETHAPGSQRGKRQIAIHSRQKAHRRGP